MFTGLIEETGRVISFAPADNAWRLQVAADATLRDTVVGNSVAVNGCCLTVVQMDERHFFFDVLEETRRLTNFEMLRAGAAVNLERSLRFGGEMGGHFVTGHIDTLGTIENFEPRGKDYYLRVLGPKGCGRYLVSKGSIAIDGISLTVAEVDGDVFAVWLIPHTRNVTNFRERQKGQRVNLEFDLLGKYVEKLLTKKLFQN
ncbi:MAG: riboflavin synthase [Verrucomicrobiota bacterium]|nr:riboflavin synthase [Verrucomicrobiota bacterium]